MSVVGIVLGVVGGIVLLICIMACCVVRVVKQNTNDCPEAITLLDQVSKQLKDKTVLITGATSGIGKETVRIISQANCNCTVILAVRTKSKAEKMISEPEFNGCNYIITDCGCDLSNLDNITNEFIPELINKHSINHIDIVWCNAGVFIDEKNLSTKNTNYEFTFATNHLGHMQLSLLLKPLLEKSIDINGEKGRLIVTSSTMYSIVPNEYMPNKQDNVFNDESWLKTYDTDREDVIHTKDAYSYSKLCNLWFVREYHRRFGSDKVICLSLAPGFGVTGMLQEKFDTLPGCCQFGVLKVLDTVGQLAFTQVWLSVTDESNLKGGEYYRGNVCYENMEQFSRDEMYTTKLWDLSQNLIDKVVSKV